MFDALIAFVLAWLMHSQNDVGEPLPVLVEPAAVVVEEVRPHFEPAPVVEPAPAPVVEPAPATDSPMCSPDGDDSLILTDLCWDSTTGEVRPPRR